MNSVCGRQNTLISMWRRYTNSGALSEIVGDPVPKFDVVWSSCSLDPWYIFQLLSGTPISIAESVRAISVWSLLCDTSPPSMINQSDGTQQLIAARAQVTCFPEVFACIDMTSEPSQLDAIPDTWTRITAYVRVILYCLLAFLFFWTLISHFLPSTRMKYIASKRRKRFEARKGDLMQLHGQSCAFHKSFPTA